MRGFFFTVHYCTVILRYFSGASAAGISPFNFSLQCNFANLLSYLLLVTVPTGNDSRLKRYC